jgi:uncharacterized protein (TIGR02466 family)
MQTSTNIIPLFSSPVYVAVDETMPDVIDEIEQWEYQNLVGGGLGSQSVEQNVLDRLPSIKEFLLPHIREYVHGVMGIDESHRIDSPCSWINVHQYLEKSGEHMHRNSMFSGIVYLRTHPNCGNLVFVNNKHDVISPHKTHTNVYNSNQWTLTPLDGMVVMFPSHLVHYVENNQDTARRYSLAFNIMIRGDFGNPTSLLSL